MRSIIVPLELTVRLVAGARKEDSRIGPPLLCMFTQAHDLSAENGIGSAAKMKFTCKALDPLSRLKNFWLRYLVNLCADDPVGIEKKCASV
jgi:hypothetical protein